MPQRRTAGTSALNGSGSPPVDRSYVGVIAMLAGIAGYVVWVHREVRRANSELQTSGQTECAVSE